MTTSRNVLTPEALTMMDVIARNGSFAAAARELGKVPSSLTYSVRQLEDALDVLLFDRRSRQAQLTAAGEELLNEGRRLLDQMDAVANRVKRVATGWETQLSIAVDDALSRVTMLELCESFYSLNPQAATPKSGDIASPSVLSSLPSSPITRGGPGTRLRLHTEVMAGTWEALTSGRADLAIGVSMDHGLAPGIQMKELGAMEFVFAVAPHHALAAADAPISDTELLRHRAVAVADTAQRLTPQTFNLLPGQDVLTVSSMQLKIQAQLRCLGCGFVPEPLAREHINAGRLVVKPVQRTIRLPRFGYAWRSPVHSAPSAARTPQLGMALRWWLAQLESPTTREALLQRHGMVAPTGL